MHFRRSGKRGFTLLEALLAAAALAFAAIALSQSYSQTAILSFRPEARLELVEFGHSLLTELASTKDYSDRSGLYGGRYSYFLAVIGEHPLAPSRFNKMIDFDRLDLTISDRRYPGLVEKLTLVVARKARQP